MEDKENSKKRRGRPPGSKAKNTKEKVCRNKTTNEKETHVNCVDIMEYNDCKSSKDKSSILVHLQANIDEIIKSDDDGSKLIKIRKPNISSNNKQISHFGGLLSNDTEINKHDIISMPEFFDANKTQKWVKSTNIKCNWCTLQFKAVPIPIPVFIDDNGIFHVEGCYCSINCALAKLLHRYNGVDKTTRISLLFYLCSKILGYEIPKDIQPSPDPIDVLVEYGKTVSRSEYKAGLLTLSSDFYLEFPPIVSIIPQVVQFSQYLTESHKEESERVDKDSSNFMNISKIIGPLRGKT